MALCYFRTLKDMLRPVIAGLFEVNEHNKLTFDQYFKAVDDIVSRIKLELFHNDVSTNYTLYLRNTDWLVFFRLVTWLVLRVHYDQTKHWFKMIMFCERLSSSLVMITICIKSLVWIHWICLLWQSFIYYKTEVVR